MPTITPRSAQAARGVLANVLFSLTLLSPLVAGVDGGSDGAANVHDHVSPTEWSRIEHRLAGGVGPTTNEFRTILSDDAQESDDLAIILAYDGETLVLGAPREDEEANSAGAAYVFERNRGGTDNWGQVQKLTASDARNGLLFGGALAINGDLILVGVSPDGNVGGAYLFGRNVDGPDQWGEIKKFTGSDEVPGDRFGSAVGISGGRAIIGSFGDDDNGGSSGSAYLFERNAGGSDNWGEVKKLTPSDATSSDWFGRAVEIDGETLVISSHTNQDDGEQAGKAYIFERNAGGADNSGEVAIHTPGADGATAWFGHEVSISGDTVAIGAPLLDGDRSNIGAVFLYSRNVGGPSNWGLVRRLLASDSALGGWLGFDVDIRGDWLVAGAVRHDHVANDAGAAYVYERNKGGTDNWGEVTELQASDGGSFDSMGVTVAIEDGLAVTGSNSAGPDVTGEAYLFDLEGCTYAEGAELVLPEGDDASSSAFALAVEGSTAVVADLAGETAWIVERNAGGADRWEAVAELIHPEGTTGATYGFDVAISGDTAIVAERDGWAAYIFDRNAGGPDAWGHVATIAEPQPTSGIWTISVGVDDGTAVVGLWEEQYYDADCADYIGHAWVYERNLGGASAWGQVAQLAVARGQNGAVAIQGGRIVAGASAGTDDCEGGAPGSVDVFERNAGGADQWGQVASLIASDATGADQFGRTVAFDDETAVVGAWQTADRSGSAYVFERNTGGADQWGEVAKLTASDAAAQDAFGIVVAIRGNRIVVGTPFDDDDGDASGAAYVFDRNEGGADQWGERTKITPFAGSAGGRFGRTVGIAGDAILVGSSGLFAGNIFHSTCATCGDGILEVPEQCDDGNTEPTDGCTPLCRIETCDDRDGDGFPRETPLCPPEETIDCDDGDPATFPGAPEVCDGRDNDCDGELAIEESDTDEDGLLACTVDEAIEPYLTPVEGGFAMQWDSDPRVDAWNLYSGDLNVLLETGVYTQEQLCGLAQPTATVPAPDTPFAVAFFLVTNVEEGLEGRLGFDSFGVERPNVNPCK